MPWWSPSSRWMSRLSSNRARASTVVALLAGEQARRMQRAWRAHSSGARAAGSASISVIHSRPSARYPRARQKRRSAAARRRPWSAGPSRTSQASAARRLSCSSCEAIQPFGQPPSGDPMGAASLRRQPCDQCEVVLGVSPLEALGLSGHAQALQRVLADRLQHPEAQLAGRDPPGAAGSCRPGTPSRRPRRGPDPARRSADDRLRRLQRAAAHEDARAGGTASARPGVSRS